MTQQQNPIIDPDLSDVLSIQKLDVFATLNCVKIGQITAFDPAKKTAQIQILFKRVYPDKSIASYPLLLDCPVFTLQGGGGAIQFPIAVGDQCIVLFSDRSIDDWYQNGAEAAPSSRRMHDISDGIALVGINALNSTLPTYPSNKVVLSYAGSRFELTSTGWNLVGTGGAEIDLDTKVGIKNSITSLLTLMTNFITLLETLQALDPVGPTNLPLTPASIAALEAYKAQFATLLE